MSDVLGSPPSPRTALLWNGTAWQWALVDAAGHLQIDALSTVMDPLAATAANQVIINTTVGLVALIRNALQTVASDRLIVRGEDQVYSIKNVLYTTARHDIADPDGYVQSPVVGAGEYWKVTSIAASNATRATTSHIPVVFHNGVVYYLGYQYHAFGIGETSRWTGEVWLDEGDSILVYMTGSLAADTGNIFVCGHYMTVET